ncbi:MULTISPECIES: GIY-YIG nuclease family protein [Chromohalobacter]|nr:MULTISPECIES: GIY-YIG nuclease family protein [Chromohalobacter]MCI0509229.1 GIY-YIG nuclease family protein [Chromohalobacter sp.]MCI0592088.1 GIY-YIG nuclease family protein [Chromohalobacter sp.]
MEIALNDLLRIADPSKFKLHLACRNEEYQEPLDAYVADPREWIGWNEWRGRRNDWTRPYILSFMDFYPRSNQWLFGGAFEVLERLNDRYRLKALSEFDQYVGRVLASFHRYQGMRGRAYYLESYIDKFKVREILPKRYSGEAFDGYENIESSFSELEAIIRDEKPDWKAALESIKGIYLISDASNGKKYVGSAYGGAGIWSRWASYIGTGHGWNDELVRLISREGKRYARENFRFAVLEVMANSTPDDVVHQRESHWKRVLLSRAHGYNSN